MTDHKVKPEDLKWEVVAEAAEFLAKIARDTTFRAPELFAMSLQDAMAQLNRIAEALCLTRLHGDKRDG